MNADTNFVDVNAAGVAAMASRTVFNKATDGNYKYLPFEGKNKVHSYAIKSVNDKDYIHFYKRKTYTTGSKRDSQEADPWDNSTSTNSGVEVYSIEFKSPISGRQANTVRQIYFTSTTPTNTNAEPASIVIYAKGNAWDLGSFHRPYRNRPFELLEANQEEKSSGESLAQKIANATQSRVYCFEYPGYGTETRKDINAIFAYLYMAYFVDYITKNSEKEKPIILYGYSVGCAVTVRALRILKQFYRESYDRISGAILQSAFQSFSKVSGDSIDERKGIEGMIVPIPSKGFDKKMYDTEALLKDNQLKVPIAFIHGYDDITCPIHRAYLLYKSYKYAFDFKYLNGEFDPNSKTYIPCDHNNVPMHKNFNDAVTELCRKLVNWEEKYLVERPNSSTDAYYFDLDIHGNYSNDQYLEMFNANPRRPFFRFYEDKEVKPKFSLFGRKAGGKPSKATAAPYVRTARKYTGRDKVPRTVYTKGSKSYVKKKAADGTFKYRPIKE